jgi:hypothetical protein
VLPQINEGDHFEALVRDVEQVEPVPEARAAYMCALSALAVGCTLLGESDRARRIFGLVGSADRALLDHEHYARGIARTYDSAFHYFIGADFHLAMTFASQAVQDLEISQAMHMQCVALALEGGVRSALGDPGGAEERGRGSLSLAEQIQAAYQAVNARFYLSLILSESSEPARLDEAERLAQAVLEAHVSASYDGVGHMVLAGLALKKRDFARAEALALVGLSSLKVFNTYSILCMAHLIKALAAQGRGHEAATAAKDGLALLRRLKGAGFAEISFRAAAVEALDGAGEREEAARVLRETCLELEARAARILDPEMRHSFVSNVADNRRVLELARAWGTAG